MFNNQIENRAMHTATKSQCLDFIETAHRDRLYPLIYCHIELNGLLDIAHLKEAVRLSSEYVPEILFCYDFKHGEFINRGLTVESTIIAGCHKPDEGWRWDLSTGPQLKIGIIHKAGKNSVLIGMSHILSDGTGFLQYLYLLAALYNGDPVPRELVNVRDIALILNNVQAGPATQQERNGKKANAQRRILNGRGEIYQCLTVTLDANILKTAQAKANQIGATLNDVFLTAYACVVAKEWNTEQVLLPCPADLRRFAPKPDVLTVANMTGMYRVAVEFPAKYSFTDLLKQVQIEMTLQKARRRCFFGISFLQNVSSKIPVASLEYLCKKYYHILPLSYTNLGIVDAERLHFQNCNIENCYLSGTYRISPDFQLSISTFRGVCTLSSSMIGSEERICKGQDILERVKEEVTNWTRE